MREMEDTMTTVIILVGPSGAGKTHHAKLLQAREQGTIICSIDDYFCRKGQYEFEPDKVGLAHAECLRKFTRELQSGYASHLIVDNPNCLLQDLAPYAALAQAYEARIDIRVFLTPFEVCVERTTKAISPKAIYNQIASRDAMLAHGMPSYWPWRVWAWGITRNEPRSDERNCHRPRRSRNNDDKPIGQLLDM